MKKALLLAAGLALVTTGALAVPYASQIRLNNTTGVIGGNLTISYILNEDADSVNIEVFDSLSASVATFPGTTTKGANSVVWDLTDDNNGGNPLAEDTGYTFEITVDAVKPAGWAVTSINQSNTIGDATYKAAPYDVLNYNNMFSRFRPHSVFVPRDPSRDDFGVIALPSSETDFSPSNFHAAVIRLNADLSTRAGDPDGYGSRVLRHPQSDGAGVTGSFQDVWFGTEDPLNPGNYFVSGQATSARTNYIYGTLDDAIASNPNTNTVDLGGPRTIAIGVEGSDRFLYASSGNTTINKYAMDANGAVSSDPPVNVLDAALPTLYSKQVFIDSLGNLYWLSRASGTTADTGAVYRWPASLVDGSGAGSLTAANADSLVTVANGVGLLGELREAPNGDIIMVGGGGTPTLKIFNLGNAADASLTPAAPLEPADAFFTLTATDNINTYAVGVDIDAFGNIYYASANTLFGAIAISPGGTSSTTVPAPASQTFDLVTVPASANDTWSLYY